MFLPESRPYIALVYLGLVALGCFIVILTPLRHLRPHVWTELKSCDTDDSTTTIILGAGVRIEAFLCSIYYTTQRTANFRTRGLTPT